MRRRAMMAQNDGGDDEMKPMILIGQIDYSDEAQRIEHTFNVNGAVEFYITWEDTVNASATNQSSLYVAIDNVRIAASNAILTSKTGGQKSYGWLDIRWNGLQWILVRSAGAISKNTAVGGNAVTQYWPGIFTNAPAQSITIEPNSSPYNAVKGVISVYARLA